MLQHLKGYQRSIMLIKTGRLNKKNNTNINTQEKEKILRNRRSQREASVWQTVLFSRVCYHFSPGYITVCRQSSPFINNIVLGVVVVLWIRLID